MENMIAKIEIINSLELYSTISKIAFWGEIIFKDTKPQVSLYTYQLHIFALETLLLHAKRMIIT
jgi:hypothetical protein